jgi:hypothetical protein
MSGQDTQFVTGGRMDVHTGQAIGILGGAVKPGEDGIGLQMIAAQGAIDIQAQSDELKIQAKDEVNIVSANAHIDWAAAKKISLSTAGGANITIENGNITIQCPGKFTVHAGKHSFNGPAKLAYELPTMPSSEPVAESVNFALRLLDIPGKYGRPLADRPWDVVLLKSDGHSAIDPEQWRETLASGRTDGDGNCELNAAQKQAIWNMTRQYPGRIWLVSGTNATVLAFSDLTASAAEKKKLQTVDALHYRSSPEFPDREHIDYMTRWTEMDYQSALRKLPKDDTEI